MILESPSDLIFQWYSHPEVAKLTTDLQTLATDIAQTQSSLKELADLRAKEHEQHEAELADLLKSIAAVTKATEVRP